MTNSRLRWLLVGTHVALADVLVAMAVPQVPKIPEQSTSGYVPVYYPAFIALTVTPFVMAAALLALLGLCGFVAPSGGPCSSAILPPGGSGGPSS